MAVKVQVPKKAKAVRFALHPLGKILLVLLVLGFTTGLAVFTFYYVKYSRLIETKLAAGPFANTSMLFAAPRTVDVGDIADPQEIATDLRRSGYTESSGNRMGYFALKPDEIDIYPGPDSYFKRDEGVIKFTGSKVTQIISLADNTDRTEYTLEPELISNLFDKNREKRRLVKYEDIPPLLVHAVVSAEDKRFFQHSGFDPIRIIKAAYVDVREHRYAQGASTLSQQLARSFWLDNDKTWRRKIPEVLITMHLEQKLKKEQIFEYYANQVPLGHRGSFGIRGFGEAAQVYFGKDVSKLTLPEAATLAGLIQQPSFTNPYRWPERARATAQRGVEADAREQLHQRGRVSKRECVADGASQAGNGVHGSAVFCGPGERHAAGEISGLQLPIQYVSGVYHARSELAARCRRSGAHRNGRG